MTTQDLETISKIRRDMFFLCAIQCRLKLISSLGCRESINTLGTGRFKENLVHIPAYPGSESLAAHPKRPMDKPALVQSGRGRKRVNMTVVEEVATAVKEESSCGLQPYSAWEIARTH
ncbi:hypothetical protein TNCV_4848711 [Trichonephila clavipes]|nr:hypothetical protein TNCV_4848711 [Trichonephila clavipes]